MGEGFMAINNHYDAASSRLHLGLIPTLCLVEKYVFFLLYLILPLNRYEKWILFLDFSENPITAWPGFDHCLRA